MAEGLTTPGANTALAALAAAYTWVQRHTGPPGAAGTANVAGDTSRIQVTWTTPAAGAMESQGAVSDVGVTTAEDYTHFSAWSASSGGTCGFTGSITCDPITVGQTVTFPAGTFDTSFPLAS